MEKTSKQSYVSIKRPGSTDQTMFAIETNDPTFTLDEFMTQIVNVASNKGHLFDEYIEHRGIAGGKSKPVPLEKQKFIGPRSLRLNKIIPEIYISNKPLQISTTEMLGVEAGYVKVLLYDEGSEMDWHCDSATREVDEIELISVKKWVQTGTLIIFPPKTVSYYEGGLLEFGCAAFTSHDTYWTYVVIPFGVKHRVTRVTTGKRIVFKSTLYRGTNQKYLIHDKEIPVIPSGRVSSINDETSSDEEEDYVETAVD